MSFEVQNLKYVFGLGGSCCDNMYLKKVSWNVHLNAKFLAGLLMKPFN